MINRRIPSEKVSSREYAVGRSYASTLANIASMTAMPMNVSVTKKTCTDSSLADCALAVSIGLV